MKNYIDEPELTKKEFLRYLLFGAVIDAALVVFLFFRMAALILKADHPLHIEMPPMLYLVGFGLVLLFSLKTLTLWRKSENHAKRFNVRVLLLSLLISIWGMFLVGIYADSILPLMGAGGSYS